MMHKVILDCDNTMGMPSWEVDDGLVILYLLGRTDIDFLGITNVFGNSSLKNVSQYTAELLRDIGRTDIPRYEGEAFHGQNPKFKAALQGVERYEGEIEQQEEITPAARFMADTVADYPGEVTILAAGPLSNLYKASLHDKSFFSNVKEIVVMGGVLENFYVGETLVEELNLACDPEASEKVLYSGTPITIMNAHVCLQAPFGKEEIERIDFWSEERKTILYNWLENFGSSLGVDVFYLWDLLLPVYISYPDLFERNEVQLTSTKKDLERGFLLRGDKGRGVTVNMPMRIKDRETFIDILFDAWQRESELEASNWK